LNLKELKSRKEQPYQTLVFIPSKDEKDIKIESILNIELNNTGKIIALTVQVSELKMITLVLDISDVRKKSYQRNPDIEVQ